MSSCLRSRKSESVAVGESRSIIVQLTANKTSYVVRQLIESMVYKFNVRARTSIDWGKPTYGNITVGPQPGQFVCSFVVVVIIIIYVRKMMIIILLLLIIINVFIHQKKTIRKIKDYKQLEICKN